jgi:hypothetical protein
MAYHLTLPTIPGALLFGPPTNSSLPGTSSEALKPAHPRLPDPAHDEALRPRIRVPDMATCIPRPGLTLSLSINGSRDRCQEQLKISPKLLLGPSTRATDFSRACGHRIFQQGGALACSALKMQSPEGSTLCLEPSYSLLRPCVPHALIPPKHISCQRGHPGQVGADLLRECIALEHALARPSIALDSITPPLRSALDFKCMSGCHERQTGGGVFAATPAGQLNVAELHGLLSQHPHYLARGAFVCFARQTGRCSYLLFSTANLLSCNILTPV